MLPRTHLPIVALAAALAIAIPLTADARDDPPPRETRISVVLPELNREVRQSWRRDGRWPRRTPNFAAEKNWAVPDEQVIRALTRPLNRNPAIDGYIKWQLLGFGVSLADLEEDPLRRILVTAPKPLAQPLPEVQPQRGRGGGVSMTFGTQIAFVADLTPIVGNGVVAFQPRVGVIGSTTRLGVSPERAERQLRDAARRANLTMREARDAIDRANRSIHAYRDLLIRLLPPDRGIRLSAMIQDVSDRLEAGDPTAELALRRLADQAATLAADPTIDPEFRRMLIVRARTLAETATPVVRAVTVEDGDLGWDYELMTLPRHDLDLLLRHLEAGGPRERPRRPR